MKLFQLAGHLGSIGHAVDEATDRSIVIVPTNCL